MVFLFTKLVARLIEQQFLLGSTFLDPLGQGILRHLGYTLGIIRPWRQADCRLGVWVAGNPSHRLLVSPLRSFLERFDIVQCIRPAKYHRAGRLAEVVRSNISWWRRQGRLPSQDPRNLCEALLACLYKSNNCNSREYNIYS